MKPEPDAPKFFSRPLPRPARPPPAAAAVALAVAIVAVPSCSRARPTPSRAPVAGRRGDRRRRPTPPSRRARHDTGVRDYRERLEQLKSKNPFDQQFADSDRAGEDGAIEPTSTGSGLPRRPAIDRAATRPARRHRPDGDRRPTRRSTTAGRRRPTPPDAGADRGRRPAVRFYADRVDVTVGPIGDTKTLEDVAAPRLPARRRSRRSPPSSGSPADDHGVFLLDPA